MAIHEAPQLRAVRRHHQSLRHAWAQAHAIDDDVYSSWLRRFPARPDVVFTRMDIPVAWSPDSVMAAEECRPVDSGPVRTVLYLHGGGFCAGSAEGYRGMISWIARLAEAKVVAPDFRLAPRWPFPAAINDAVDTYRHLLAQEDPPNAIILAGDSTGGGQVLSTLLMLRDRGLPMPAGAVLLSPFVDLAVTGQSVKSNEDEDSILSGAGLQAAAQHYLGVDDDRKDPVASPLYGDLAGLPPLLIHVGDTEVLLDDSVRLARKARTAGIDVTCRIWPEMPHVFQLFSDELREAREALEGIAEFIRKRTDSTGK